MTEWTPFKEYDALTTKYPELTKKLMAEHPFRLFRNNLYTVTMRAEKQGAMSLSIKANDGSKRHDWEEFQRIKNELAGAECEALEIYPAESRLVNTANQWWLWVLPAGVRIPLGFAESLDKEDALRMAEEEENKLRAANPEWKCDDCGHIGNKETDMGHPDGQNIEVLHCRGCGAFFQYDDDTGFLVGRMP